MQQVQRACVNTKERPGRLGCQLRNWQPQGKTTSSLWPKPRCAPRQQELPPHSPEPCLQKEWCFHQQCNCHSQQPFPARAQRCPDEEQQAGSSCELREGLGGLSQAPSSKFCPLQGESAPTLGPGSTGRQRAALQHGRAVPAEGRQLPLPLQGTGQLIAELQSLGKAAHPHSIPGRLRSVRALQQERHSPARSCPGRLPVS